MRPLAVLNSFHYLLYSRIKRAKKFGPSHFYRAGNFQQQKNRVGHGKWLRWSAEINAPTRLVKGSIVLFRNFCDSAVCGHLPALFFLLLPLQWQ